ncbi:DNA methylase N-4/N-6 domain protein [Exiguobacterium sibiricum 255-15]|uniref:Methyltransferase n=1 Tax=Exiguobacterium sibiricum (strain DSM 17290 / CCUG 55495 / CIP 109462 / JCM 13490 / 255-15) TaxID=262543 RepID=B1YL23_EXIS2|nr:site-specific DNA-methyltransferase [Exiguobacterium sibiricum]ACB61825.1 DNA methylase N-4/N-6 domain protein [Exiguobacterium sibiricum 255-15]
MLNSVENLNMQDLNQYINGSSLFLKEYFEKTIPFVDLIVTSPPYWDMKDYGEVKEQTGFGQEYAAYLKDIKKIFEGVYHIAKDSASMFVIVDTMKRDGRMIRLPDDISRELETVGWVHQDTIIWDKGKTLPWSRKGQMRNVFEYVLMFTKGKSTSYKYYIDRIKTTDKLKEWWIDYPERYGPQGKVPDNIWEFYIPTQGSWGSKKDFGEEEFRHACPFPPEMMARLILLATDENDVVFDPFAGTGVLLATAEKMNRRFLGFDTNPDYKKVFESVTKELVDEKWNEIESYYNYQNRLKKILEESIYKLRVLKYPKAVIKSMRNAIKKNPGWVANNFSLIIAIENKLEKNEVSLKNKTIGKVDYYFVWNDKETIVQAKNQILELISKAPFTKYGLIVNVNVLLVEEMSLLLDQIPNVLNVYTQGNTTNSVSVVDIKNFFELVKSKSLISEFDKDIPPLLSNVKIKYEDYEMLPAEKYEKKGYSKEIKQLSMLLK